MFGHSVSDFRFLVFGFGHEFTICVIGERNILYHSFNSTDGGAGTSYRNRKIGFCPMGLMACNFLP